MLMSFCFYKSYLWILFWFFDFVDVSISVDDDVPEEVYSRNDEEVLFLPLVETDEKNITLQWVVTVNDTVVFNESRPGNNNAYASGNKFIFEFKEVSYQIEKKNRLLKKQNIKK